MNWNPSQHVVGVLYNFQQTDIYQIRFSFSSFRFACLGKCLEFVCFFVKRFFFVMFCKVWKHKCSLGEGNAFVVDDEVNIK